MQATRLLPMRPATNVKLYRRSSTVVNVVGFIGNSLVIIVVLKFGYMRTLTNVLLVNLSVGNLLVVLVCMPFSLAPYVYKVSESVLLK